MSGGVVREESQQLSTAIKDADSELVAIEEMLGLKEADDESKVPGYGDVPRRLDTLISLVTKLAHRLLAVKTTVLRLKETVG